MQRTRTLFLGLSLDFLIIGIGAASLLGFLGRVDWTLDLFSHFRVQYLILHGITLGVAFVMKRRRAIWLAGGFVLFHLWFIVPFYLPKPAISPPGPVYRLLSANVLRDNTEFNRVLDLIQTTDPDIILLQEINQRWLDALSLENTYPYAVPLPRDDHFGYALYSKFPMLETQKYHLGDGQYFAVVAEIQLADQTFTFIGTHPPPPTGQAAAQRRNIQLQKIVAFADNQPGHVMLAGDLNTTSWSPFFAEAFAGSSLIDSRLGFGIQPTWPMDRPFFFRIPIDHVFTTAGIAILHRTTGPQIGSDHLPVILDFAIP
ncbi:MAG: endonuclease/exonuclease/phosphatase family protein [Anaerolineales bacterium]